jgi:hypothetical protein
MILFWMLGRDVIEFVLFRTVESPVGLGDILLTAYVSIFWVLPFKSEPLGLISTGSGI